MRMIPRQSQIPLGYVNPTQAPPPPPAPMPAPVSETDQALEELRKLGELKAQGVLTDDEFATMKARILAD
jgi:hypothetical protein